ncbi:dTDP-4-amino-4,6-dideoxygalactose transaminase [Corallincola spongiicola]|uniref:dTDP-4-amino-4,6-dideoxygalactose transaminase n=1 Tax=Corallincola spongiicola TaxID=2520508 RepID=A0ABY1WKI1_9GAMM|nr:dTDP-4-amino-4,6-dideoxygalactose transaminase [Corallincola spongiicola]TAA39587.1 dTDP-4-amino-4,6-dideoxygalactose transaminase [Corallincola spongiicola]
MIPFNRPPVVGTELASITDAIKSNKLCGDGPFTESCKRWIESNFDTPLALLTPSCTAALEMAAILIDIRPGDEVIMPSYTFVSTANAFVLRGARVVFVDIRPDTMNMDESLIELAVNKNTKAIVPVHYAGVGCDMDEIMSIAAKYRLWVIEDAAQGVMSRYGGTALGTIGHLGCYSFHGTKNYTSGGEGGALLVNDDELIERAEVIREKGTDRSRFCRGQVDKYTWRDIGSSFLMSDLQAAYLNAQLEQAEVINNKRIDLWTRYANNLKVLEEHGLIEIQYIPSKAQPNAHMFYIKLKDIDMRTELISFLKGREVISSFHYIPLHTSPAGMEFGSFLGEDKFTTKESERLLRLPMYYNLPEADVDFVCQCIRDFFI